MAIHEKFDYDSLNDLMSAARRLNLHIPVAYDLGVLAKPLPLGKWSAPNSLAVHPVPQYAAAADGSPGELTFRRYQSLGEGGAGLIWFGPVAVGPEGRSRKGQLFLDSGNIKQFSLLIQKTLQASRAAALNATDPICILQLSYSQPFPHLKPSGVEQPTSPPAEVETGFRPTDLVSDAHLEQLEDAFADRALLALQAGFHGISIQCSHNDLPSGLLSAHSREGPYGGGYMNRTRFLLNMIDKIRAFTDAGFLIAVHLNVWDGTVRPFSSEAGQSRREVPDLSEALRLLRLLQWRGIKLLSVTMGNMDSGLHLGSPFDAGPYTPPEHPLEGVARLIDVTARVQKAFPDLAVLGSGLSWLRHLAPFVGAGAVTNGLAKAMGFGRLALAYPGFAREILTTGTISRFKCCVTCGSCAVMQRSGTGVGCPVRDREVYGPVFRRVFQEKCKT